MGKKKSKPTIDCKPVTWVNDNIVKYQTIGRYGDVSVIGDPMPTPEKAHESFVQRLKETTIAVAQLHEMVMQANCKAQTEKTPQKQKQGETTGLIEFV